MGARTPQTAPSQHGPSHSPLHGPPIHFKPVTSGLGFQTSREYQNLQPPVLPARRVKTSQRSGPPPAPFSTNSTKTVSSATVDFSHASRLDEKLPTAPPSDLLGFGHCEIQFGYGYLLKRVAAFLMDLTLNLTLLGVATAGFMFKLGFHPRQLLAYEILPVTVVFLLVFTWAVVAAEEVAFGTTAGKKILSLSIDGPVGTVFLRSLLFLFSMACFGLGIFYALFDRKKRCWHDALSGLQPIEIAKL